MMETSERENRFIPELIPLHCAVMFGSSEQWKAAAKQIQTQIRLRAEHCPVRRGVAELERHAAGSCGVM